jgi:hypothetical protein
MVLKDYSSNKIRYYIYLIIFLLEQFFFFFKKKQNIYLLKIENKCKIGNLKIIIKKKEFKY